MPLPAGSDRPVTVAVTGATGFVGLNLLHALVGAGHRVVGLAANPLPSAAAASLAQGSATPPAIAQVDVRDTAAVGALFAAHRPEAVIHSAAVTAGPDRERSDARVIVDVNVGGTQSVLDVCTSAGVRRIVYVSSGAVYGDLTFGDEELTETARVVPTGLYGITKLTGEQLVRRHGQLHALETVTARLSAVYGPWEYPTGVRDFMTPMLQLAQAARRGETSRYVSDADRNWVSAGDVAAALVALALGPSPTFDCYNVCPPTRFGMEKWIARLREVYPTAGFEAVVDPAQATITYDADPRRQRAGVRTQRIQQELGEGWWTEVDAALDGYAAWLQRHPHWLETGSARP